MWFEFLLFGLILSGPVWVYQNTQGRGNIFDLPLWMQKPWVSLLTMIYSLSLFVFVVFGFMVDGFGGLLDILAMMIGVVVGSAYIPHAFKNILFIIFPFLAYLLADIILIGY